MGTVSYLDQSKRRTHKFRRICRSHKLTGIRDKLFRPRADCVNCIFRLSDGKDSVLIFDLCRAYPLERGVDEHGHLRPFRAYPSGTRRFLQDTEDPFHFCTDKNKNYDCQKFKKA